MDKIKYTIILMHTTQHTYIYIYKVWVCVHSVVCCRRKKKLSRISKRVLRIPKCLFSLGCSCVLVVIAVIAVVVVVVKKKILCVPTSIMPSVVCICVDGMPLLELIKFASNRSGNNGRRRRRRRQHQATVEPAE